MPSPAPDRRRSWGPTALAVVLGIGTGFALRPRSTITVSSSEPASSQATGGLGSSKDSEKQPRGATKLRSRTAEEGLSFSRKQWRELQRGSANLQIDLADCLLWQRTIETPVENEPGWGSDGYSTKKTDGGPDLEPITAFLGLDETKGERLRETLNASANGSVKSNERMHNWSMGAMAPPASVSEMKPPQGVKHSISSMENWWNHSEHATPHASSPPRDCFPTRQPQIASN